MSDSPIAFKRKRKKASQKKARHQKESAPGRSSSEGARSGAATFRRRPPAADSKLSFQEEMREDEVSRNSFDRSRRKARRRKRGGVDTSALSGVANVTAAPLPQGTTSYTAEDLAALRKNAIYAPPGRSAAVTAAEGGGLSSSASSNVILDSDNTSGLQASMELDEDVLHDGGDSGTATTTSDGAVDPHFLEAGGFILAGKRFGDASDQGRLIGIRSDDEEPDYIEGSSGYPTAAAAGRWESRKRVQFASSGRRGSFPEQDDRPPSRTEVVEIMEDDDPDLETEDFAPDPLSGMPVTDREDDMDEMSAMPVAWSESRPLSKERVLRELRAQLSRFQSELAASHRSQQQAAVAQTEHRRKIESLQEAMGHVEEEYQFYQRVQGSVQAQLECLADRGPLVAEAWAEYLEILTGQAESDDLTKDGVGRTQDGEGLLASLVEDAGRIFADVREEYRDYTALLQLLEEWQKRFPKSYTDAYISLALPGVLAPYIRLEMLRESAPLVRRSFQEHRWYQRICVFPTPPHEEDILVPTLVQKLVLPGFLAQLPSVLEQAPASQRLRDLALEYVDHSPDAQGEITEILRKELARLVQGHPPKPQFHHALDMLSALLTWSEAFPDLLPLLRQHLLQTVLPVLSFTLKSTEEWSARAADLLSEARRLIPGGDFLNSLVECLGTPDQDRVRKALSAAMETMQQRW